MIVTYKYDNLGSTNGLLEISVTIELVKALKISERQLVSLFVIVSSL